jgi:hypothetical protein
VVDAFMKDALCFPTLRPKFAASLLAVSTRLADPDALSKIRPDLPIYLFSGSEDPAGQQLEGVRTLIDRYRKAGVRNISSDYYDGGHHEMLNELNRGRFAPISWFWLSAVNLLIWSPYDLNGQASFEGAANATNANRKAKAVSRPYSYLSDGGRHSGGHHRELEQLGE